MKESVKQLVAAGMTVCCTDDFIRIRRRREWEKYDSEYLIWSLEDWGEHDPYTGDDNLDRAVDLFLKKSGFAQEAAA